MSFEEFRETYDRLSWTTVKSLGFYLEEIARREFKEMQKQKQAMTRQVHNMTIAILILTAINVVAFCLLGSQHFVSAETHLGEENGKA